MKLITVKTAVTRELFNSMPSIEKRIENDLAAHFVKEVIKAGALSVICDNDSPFMKTYTAENYIIPKSQFDEVIIMLKNLRWCSIDCDDRSIKDSVNEILALLSK